MLWFGRQTYLQREKVMLCVHAALRALYDHRYRYAPKRILPRVLNDVLSVIHNVAFALRRSPDVPGTAEAITQLGCKHVSKSVSETHVDDKNKLVTTCAFMCKAPLHEIFDGIGAMVQDVLKLA